MILDLDMLQTVIPKECKFIGNKDLKFIRVNSIYEVKVGEISWIKPMVKNEENLLNNTLASAIICTKESFEKYQGSLEKILFIIHPDPEEVYVRILDGFFKVDEFDNSLPLIHPTATVHPNCKMGENVRIGAYSIIGECEIGSNTRICEHVKVFKGVTIGKNCLIRIFNTIGGSGFGYYREKDNSLTHIPHIGKVIIEDNVTIFPYCNIDLGTLGQTIIGEGTVLDHYIHVGHNCQFGKHNLVACKSSFGGGSRIGDNCFIGVMSMVRQKAEIGSNVITGMGSVVVKDIPDNQIWAGNPAKFLKNNA